MTMILKTVDELCRIVNELADIVYQQAVIIEQSDIAEEVKKEMKENHESIQARINAIRENEDII